MFSVEQVFISCHLKSRCVCAVSRNISVCISTYVLCDFVFYIYVYLHMHVCILVHTCASVCFCAYITVCVCLLGDMCVSVYDVR